MLGAALRVIPYCGLPPAPDHLWYRWNLDPVLLAVLAGLAALYALGAARLRRESGAPTRVQQASFYAGGAIAAFALVSPLCALSVSLFAARVGQHMLLTLVAAPLMALGSPGACVSALLRRRAGPTTGRLADRPVVAAGLFCALLWFWHAPAPYAATFASPTIYWTMHASLIGSALWLWSEILLDRTPARALRTVGAGLISTVQMGFLGALLTLAPRALFAPHALTTAAWGLTPLQDQQLGGAIMWIPGCAVFLAAAMAALWPALASATVPPAGLRLR